MVKLKLLDLRCIKNQEVGGDEPYLKVRNNKVWSAEDVKAGAVISLRSLQAFSFTDTIDLTLMEKDFRDDCLGTYQLIYEVIA
jgi:hypothetical protein